MTKNEELDLEIAATLPPSIRERCCARNSSKPLGLTAGRIAKACGIARSRIERVAAEEIGISGDTAVLLGRALGTGPELWMNLQARYEIETAKASIGDDILRVKMIEIAEPTADEPPMRSTRCPGISVEIEGHRRLYSPRLQRIMSEIGYLTPDGGPSFLIIGCPGRDYLQIAGGDGAYILERREYCERLFRHFAAGHPGTATDVRVEVPIKGAHISVRANEKLALGDVQSLATDFIEGRSRSDRFVWRDMTPDFD